MKTEEGNKLIDKSPFGRDAMYLQRCPEHLLKYHSSWDWIMPVVEKIEAIKNSDDYEVDIFGNCCDIGGRFEGVGKTKIEATYKAVIQFIQWYQKNAI